MQNAEYQEIFAVSNRGMDPCQLAWQVNETRQLTHEFLIPADPCRLVRQVNKIGQLPAGENLLHLPGKLAGVVSNPISLLPSPFFIH